MKCFSYFKDKSKTRQTKSAPEATERRKSDNSAAKRINKSSSSIDTTASSSHRSLPSLYEEKAHNLRVFSFSELKIATNDFNRMLKLGEGGFGSVYKGFVKPSDGSGGQIAVAIKKLNKDSLQGHKQWMAEIQFLAVVEHPNLVKLIGYCAEDTERGIERLLVYEFIPNRTLEDHLFNRSLPVLPWNRRLEIVLGAAQGLSYLHGGLDIQVIYRDFKASNVLLDMEFKPKLSDFGLAREGPSLGRSHVSTAVVGTYGYADPDYVNTGHLTLKSDVWSFGVVLYEILTGRRALDKERPAMERKLLDWVKLFPADSKKFFMIMDPRLRNQYSPNAARMIAKLADSCLSKSSKDRPTMAELVERLKQVIQVSEIEGSPETATTSSSAVDRVTDKKPAQVNIPEYSRRRMAQVAKLREHANAVGITVGVQRK